MSRCLRQHVNPFLNKTHFTFESYFKYVTKKLVLCYLRWNRMCKLIYVILMMTIIILFLKSVLLSIRSQIETKAYLELAFSLTKFDNRASISKWQYFSRGVIPETDGNIGFCDLRCFWSLIMIFRTCCDTFETFSIPFRREDRFAIAEFST